jgi:hypothetical protein
MDSTTITLGGGSSAIYTSVDSMPGRGQLSVSIPDPLTGGGTADFTGRDTASIISQLNESITNFQDVAQKNPSMAAHSNQQIAAYRSVISQLGSTGAVQRVIDADAASASTETALPQPLAPTTAAVSVEQSLSKGEELVLEKNRKASSEATDKTSPIRTTSNDSDAAPSENTVKLKTPTTTFEKPKAMPNPLHNYATYTYGMTLYILSADDFNNLQRADVGALDSWKPTYALISSGGNHRADRHPAFKDDFYFDNLKMTTVVGLNAMSRGSNAIQLNFTVIEPYGLTLLDRIMDAAEEVGSKNYLTQPYMLEIDFYGSDDLGQASSPIHNLRKRIPIQLLEMKIKAGNKGSEYRINCCPYNHNAFMDSSVSTPANFEIQAKTIKDFFSNTGANSLEAQKKQKDDARYDAIAARGIVNDDDGNPLPGVGRVGIGGNESELTRLEAIDKTPYKVDSYAAAVNAWNQKIVDNQHYKFSNEIEFDIDEAFKDSPIVTPSKTSPTRSAISGTSVSEKKASAQGNDPTISDKTPTADFDKTRMNFSINAGTSVIDVINNVMRNSDYIKNQVINKTSDKIEFYKDKTVDYFKIIPQVFLKEFDPKRNAYATKTVYHIKKYSYFNSKHPDLPYGTPDGPVKEYNYMYTGKNIDILDFSIDFDTAYYTSKVVDNNKEAIDTAPDANSESPVEPGKIPTGAGSVTPNKSSPRSSEANVTSTMADTDKAATVANAMNSLYSNSRGDMLNIKLKILGDPHFVKQDDIYTNPGMSGYNDKPVMINNGTIAMDAREIFCILNFKTPVDMDENTGLLRTDGRYVSSRFNGLFKILTIESEFSRGQFVQTLDIVRIFDKPVGLATASEDRQDSAAAEEDAQNGSSEVRLPSLDSSVKTPEVVSKATSIIDKIKAEEEKFVSQVKTKANELVNEVKIVANDIRKKLSDDLSSAKTVSIGEQVAQDNNSPEPQNPAD